jgi:hypothetical protein
MSYAWGVRVQRSALLCSSVCLSALFLCTHGAALANESRDAVEVGVQATAPRWTLPVIVHIAQVSTSGTTVTDDDFVTKQVARANAIFARYDVSFRIEARQTMSAAHARLETREDRDRLGNLLAGVGVRGSIHCFVVESLRDVDEPSRMRRGVHWHVGSRSDGAHYVIITASAPENVLAHELGHFLGNVQHSLVRDNLMSYEQSGALPFLDETQLARMHKRIRRYVRERELRVLTPAP